MIPTQALVNQIRDVIAADTGSLAAASALKVHLAQAAFVPSAALLIGGLTEATFVGATALAAGIGTAQKFNDAGGGRVAQLLEPAAGWHWQATASTSLPQTIYGWYVTDNGSTTLWGSALFTSPILIAVIGDAVDVPQVRITIPPGVIF